jgi:Transglutaminase-like superfamily
MRTWAGRVRRMRASDYLTATEVLALAVWVEIAIRVMPFSRVLERMTRASSPVGGQIVILAGARATRKNHDLTPNEYRRLLRFVGVAYDVLPLPATCLRQSLVLYGLLERRGVPSRLRFGVAKRGPVFAAHAWVECDGVARDEGARRYSELRELSFTPRP